MKTIISAIISLMIITAVSVVVFGGAGYILFVSATDKYSNLNLVENCYNNYNNHSLVKTAIAIESINANSVTYKDKIINNVNLKILSIINIFGNK
jgi:hypothetical protein